MSKKVKVKMLRWNFHLKFWKIKVAQKLLKRPKKWLLDTLGDFDLKSY